MTNINRPSSMDPLVVEVIIHAEDVKIALASPDLRPHSARNQVPGLKLRLRGVLPQGADVRDSKDQQ